MTHRTRLLASLLAALASLGATTGCVILGTAGNDPDALTTVDLPPGGADFKPVGVFLVHRCGSLDCHGEIGRNLRLYGEYGLRLDPMNVPSGGLTTADELDADFQSVVALEPELMSEVVAQAQADPTQLNPTLLTFYRKPTGMEAHKGGQLILPPDPTTNTPGDDQDTCIRSWLAGTVDTTACGKAADPSLYP